MAGRKSTFRRRKLWVVPLILAAVLLAALIAVAVPTVRMAMDPYGGRILKGISAAGVSLDGMTRYEAARALENAMEGKELTLTIPGKSLTLSSRESGLELDVQGIVKAAYAIGRQEDAVFPLPLARYLLIDADACRTALEQAGAALAADYVPGSYRLEGELPELTEDRFQPDTPLPTLVVQTGVPAYAMNVDLAWGMVLQGLSQGEFTIDLTASLSLLAEEALDADTILSEIARPAVDAHINKSTLQAVPGSYGISFDSAALAAALREAAPGTQLRVALKAEAPAILGQEVYFQDVLGFCQTPHSDDEKRCTNLRLACEALNGVVLQPGQTLSYNATLGQRTAEAGYQNAPAYSGTQLVNTLGGGICQVSSTLYLSSLYAELETVERVCHGYPSSYMPVGLDATVSWGSPDLKIKNDSLLPVKIVAEDQEGFVRVWIMGTETRDYYIRMGYSGSSDHYARSYVCKYDSQTQQQISREDHLFSSYLSGDTSVVGEIGSDEAYVNGMVRKMPSCSPTPEALEASLNYREPNTKG